MTTERTAQILETELSETLVPLLDKEESDVAKELARRSVLAWKPLLEKIRTVEDKTYMVDSHSEICYGSRSRNPQEVKNEIIDVVQKTLQKIGFEEFQEII